MSGCERLNGKCLKWNKIVFFNCLRTYLKHSDHGNRIIMPEYKCIKRLLALTVLNL